MTVCGLVVADVLEDLAAPIIGVVQTTLKTRTGNVSEEPRTASYPKILVSLNIIIVRL